MARLAPQLTAGFEFKFDNREPVSRISATLNLSYHQVRYSMHLVPVNSADILQCVVLATRPLLLCLLQDALARRRNVHRDLAGPIKALLSTSEESANKSLRILSTLQSQHLLGEQFFGRFGIWIQKYSPFHRDISLVRLRANLLIYIHSHTYGGYTRSFRS